MSNKWHSKGGGVEIKHGTYSWWEPADNDGLIVGTQQGPSVLWYQWGTSQLNDQAYTNQMAFRKCQEGVANWLSVWLILHSHMV